MGRNNRQRRAAKAKERLKSGGGRTQGPRVEQRFDAPTQREFARALMYRAADAWLRERFADARDAVRALAELEPRVVCRESEAALLARVGWLWDHGWQPSEVVRHVRRTDARLNVLAATAIAADHGLRAPATLSAPWAAQIRELSLPHVDSGTGWLDAVFQREGLDHVASIWNTIRLVGTLAGVGALPRVIAAPGSPSVRDAPTFTSRVDDPILVKVRALLAQAESTTFEAEAEAFTAKAQELMARHSIDSALLWAQSARAERPVTIRLPIDDPYADIKSLLLDRIAHHSRCRAVYHPSYGLTSVVGFEGDVAAAETLFTSLLVQSHAALRAEAVKAPPGGRARSRSFRSSFLMAFTARIDERLAEVTAHVESAVASTQRGALLPALIARESAVNDSVTEMFGAVESSVVRGGRDAAGWARGRLAADEARLNAGDVTSPPKRLGAA